MPPRRGLPRGGGALYAVVLLVDWLSFASGQLDGLAGLGAAAVNLASSNGGQAVKSALADAGLASGLASVGADAARAAAQAAAAAGAQVTTAPNADRAPARPESKAHRAADRAAAPIGTGASQVLAVAGVQGGGSVFGATMGSAPGVDVIVDASAPPGYVAPPVDGAAVDAAWVKAEQAKEKAAGGGGAGGGDGGGGLPNLLGGQMNVAGAAPDPAYVDAVKGAAAFPGGGGAAAVKHSMYPTNDAGTGPAPVGGGGFQPINGGGFDVAPLSAANPGLTMGGGGGGGAPANPAPPLPPPGGVSFAQQPTGGGGGGGGGGDGLIHAPGARGAPSLGVPDTQPSTTTLRGTGPGGLPVTMTIG